MKISKCGKKIGATFGKNKFLNRASIRCVDKVGCVFFNLKISFKKREFVLIASLAILLIIWCPTRLYTRVTAFQSLY